MAKAKVSRPILYAVVAAVVTYAVVILTEPEPPPRKAAVRAGRSSATAPNGFTEADQTARFARYSGRQRDAFLPGVVPDRPPAGAASGAAANAAAAAPAGTSGAWVLTGISVVNGVRSALIEAGSTGESLFLKAGDRWNGLRVASVESDAVVFVNALGQQTRLAFSETAAPGTQAGGAGTAAAGAGLSSPGATASAPAGSAVPAAPPRTDRERNANRP